MSDNGSRKSNSSGCSDKHIELKMQALNLLNLVYSFNKLDYTWMWAKARTRTVILERCAKK